MGIDFPKPVSQSRLGLMQGCRETEKSPEMEGKAQSAALGDTENHISCTQLGSAFGKRITTDYLFLERINMNLWCTAWERRMVTAPLEARGFLTGAMKNLWGKMKGQPAHRQMAIINFQLNRAARADKGLTGLRPLREKLQAASGKRRKGSGGQFLTEGDKGMCKWKGEFIIMSGIFKMSPPWSHP